MKDNTELHRAAARGDVAALLRALVDTDPDVRDAEGATPLRVAIQHRQQAAAAALLLNADQRRRGQDLRPAAGLLAGRRRDPRDLRPSLQSAHPDASAGRDI